MIPPLRRLNVGELLDAAARAPLADLPREVGLNAIVERAARAQAQQADAAVLRGLAAGLCSVDVPLPGYSIVVFGQAVNAPDEDGVRRFYLHGPLDPWPFWAHEIPVISARRTA